MFVLAAVGTAVTWVGTTAAAVGSAASMALTYAGLSAGQIAAFGTVASVAGQFALSAAVSALMAPRVGSGGSPVAFKADPEAPISGVMGRFGVGGRQLHANTWGKDNLYLSFAVALSLGPIQSVEAFTANRVAVTFPGSQGLAAAVEPYKDKMWQTRRLGLPTDAYLSPPTGVPDGSPAMSEWTSSHTLPGVAHAFWTLKNNSKRASYESGVPAPLWTLHGMKLWDPREDSTYPGGSGSQRRDDWTTWAYTDDPYLHALAFTRGHFKLNTDGTIDRTKRLAGVGAPDAAIDIGAFVEGANVCEANGWTISGEWTTVDDKWQVLAAMLQAGGGVPLNRGAQISCMVEAPRTSLLTLTGEDIVGSVSLNVMASRRDRPNTIVPRVRLEAQNFEEVALGAVTSSTYVTEDGGETRTREVPYRYVGLAQQGAELAAYGLANARETLKASIPCKPHLLGLRAGDAFTVTEPELGLSGQKFVVLKRAFDPSTCIVTLEVRSETDAKHAWALGQTADPPETPSLTASDPIPTTPVDGDWTVIPRPAEAGGIQQPGFIVSGSAVGDNVGAVQIEAGATDEGPWEQVYHGPPTTEEVPVNGLNAGGTYYVAVTYWSLRAVPSLKLVKGPYTAPGLTAGDVSATSPFAQETFDRLVDEILARTLSIMEEQDRRFSDTTDTQRYIDRIGVVDPATGWVDLRANRVRAGLITMATVGERVGSGLSDGGFIAKPIPQLVAEASNAHNGQLSLAADGELVDAVGTRGQVTIPGMGIDVAIDYSVGTLENEIITGAAPAGAVAYGAALKRDTGPQGGRLFVEKPLTGTTMTGDLLVDLYGDTIRFADASTLVGFFLDMGEAGASISARIWHSNNVPALKTALGLPSGGVVGTTDVQTLTNKTLTAPVINSPTGILKGDVGLGNVDNTSDANKPVSTAQQAALDLKANLASPTFTGTVGGITKSMVGLSSVDNTADTAKPVSTAQQAALDLKAPLTNAALVTPSASLPTYADNAAAVSGGLAADALYKTATGEVRIRV